MSVPSEHICEIPAEELVQSIGQQARAAYATLALASQEKKNMALVGAAMELRAQIDKLKEANAKDIAFGKEKGLSDAMLDRLMLNEGRIEGMAAGLETD